MSLVALKRAPAMPLDTPSILRKLADDVEAGSVDSMVVAYVQDDSYCFLWPSSLIESMTLTTLAHASAVDRMRE